MRLKVSTDGRRFAVVLGKWYSFDERSAVGAVLVTIRETEQGTEAASFEIPKGEKLLALSPSLELLATAESDRTVTVWDIHKRKIVRTLKEAPFDDRPNQVYRRKHAAFSVDGKLLAVSGTPPEALAPDTMIWEVSSGHRLALIQHQLHDQLLGLCFSADGGRLFTYGFSNGRQAKRGDVQALGKDSSVEQVEDLFNTGGTHAVTAWDTLTGQEVLSLGRGHVVGNLILSARDARVIGATQ